MTRSWKLPIVIDASALVELLLQTRRAAAVAQATADLRMIAPDHVNVEVLSVLRRLERQEVITPSRAAQALDDLCRAPVRRLSTAGLLATIWALRHNVSAYDAAYVALARAVGCGLVTADARLSRASVLGVFFTVV